MGYGHRGNVCPCIYHHISYFIYITVPTKNDARPVTHGSTPRCLHPQTGGTQSHNHMRVHSKTPKSVMHDTLLLKPNGCPHSPLQQNAFAKLGPEGEAVLQVLRDSSGVGGRAKVDPAKVLKAAKLVGADGLQVRNAMSNMMSFLGFAAETPPGCPPVKSP